MWHSAISTALCKRLSRGRCKKIQRKGLSSKHLPDFSNYLLFTWKYYPFNPGTIGSGFKGSPLLPFVVGGFTCTHFEAVLSDLFNQSNVNPFHSQLSKIASMVPRFILSSPALQNSLLFLRGWQSISFLNVWNWKLLWNNLWISNNRAVFCRVKHFIRISPSLDILLQNQLFCSLREC